MWHVYAYPHVCRLCYIQGLVFMVVVTVHYQVMKQWSALYVFLYSHQYIQCYMQLFMRTYSSIVVFTPFYVRECVYIYTYVYVDIYAHIALI